MAPRARARSGAGVAVAGAASATPRLLLFLHLHLVDRDLGLPKLGFLVLPLLKGPVRAAAALRRAGGRGHAAVLAQWRHGPWARRRTRAPARRWLGMVRRELVVVHGGFLGHGFERVRGDGRNAIVKRGISGNGNAFGGREGAKGCGRGRRRFRKGLGADALFLREWIEWVGADAQELCWT